MQRYKAAFAEVRGELTMHTETIREEADRQWASVIIATIKRTEELLGSPPDVWDGNRSPNVPVIELLSPVAQALQMATDLLANEEIRNDSTLGVQLESLRLLLAAHTEGRFRLKGGLGLKLGVPEA